MINNSERATILKQKLLEICADLDALYEQGVTIEFNPEPRK